MEEKNKDNILEDINQVIENSELSNDDIGDTISSAMDLIQEDKDEHKEILLERARENRKEREKDRVVKGKKRLKQSKFKTRSDDFLKKEIKVLHIVLHTGMQYGKEESDQTKLDNTIYLDGVDFAHRRAFGAAHWGRANVKNVFERLIELQDLIRMYVGTNSLAYPKWFVFSNSTSMIQDRNILSRLDELKDKTHCAGAYGFEKIGKEGKFFEPERQEDTKGCFIQGDLGSNNWDFIVGHKFREAAKYKIVCVYGPLIAIRGSTFMTLNLEYMAKNMKSGFYHYMADLSLECVSRGYFAATIKTICQQFDNIKNHVNSEEFKHDQAIFYNKWKKILPLTINDPPKQI